MSEAAELAAVCAAAAEAGARVLRERLDRPREVHFKGAIDLVTDADEAAEAAVLAVIAERAPGAAVLAEESGAHAGGALRFIVDPLDGTTNYAHGLPLFSCTVAAEARGQVLAGCTVDPVRGERFRAVRGGGAWLEERRLSVSAATDLSQALVCNGFPYHRGPDLAGMLAAFALFTERARGTRRLGSAALDLAYVACGRLDGFWERGLKAWDVAAGALMVEEAGGVVSRFDGSAHEMGAGEILAAPRALHARMMAVLAEAGPRSSPGPGP